MSTSLSLAKDLSPFSTIAVTVPPGANQGNNGIVVVRASTAASDGASEANNTNYFLAYEPGAGDPGVLFNKKNFGQTTFPQTNDCRAIHF